MASCPDGLQVGFGLPPGLRSSICVSLSDFGIGPGGLIKRRWGTGLLFHNSAQSSFVVTAGHNLYDHGLQRRARAVNLWFGRVGDVAQASREMRDLRIPGAFAAAGSPRADLDYGVVRVVLLDPGRFMPVKLRVTAAPTTGRALLSGYPNEDACAGRRRPFHKMVDLLSVGADNFGYVAQPSYEGLSGAPLLVQEGDGQYGSYGLHIRGEIHAERAVRLTATVRQQILAWLPAQ